MKNLTIFNYEEKQVRTVEINGEVWWVLKDVCDIFGDSHYRRISESLDEDEKGVTEINTPGGKQNMIIVNEFGLYSLLFAMQPKKARNVSDDYVAALALG